MKLNGGSKTWPSENEPFTIKCIEGKFYRLRGQLATPMKPPKGWTPTTESQKEDAYWRNATSRVADDAYHQGKTLNNQLDRMVLEDHVYSAATGKFTRFEINTTTKGNLPPHHDTALVAHMAAIDIYHAARLVRAWKVVEIRLSDAWAECRLIKKAGMIEHRTVFWEQLAAQLQDATYCEDILTATYNEEKGEFEMKRDEKGRFIGKDGSIFDPTEVMTSAVVSKTSILDSHDPADVIENYSPEFQQLVEKLRNATDRVKLADFGQWMFNNKSQFTKEEYNFLNIDYQLKKKELNPITELGKSALDWFKGQCAMLKAAGNIKQAGVLLFQSKPALVEQGLNQREIDQLWDHYRAESAMTATTPANRTFEAPSL
jgi:hypothetical protein